MNIINQKGGTVNIVSPVLDEYREPPHRAQRKNWKHTWRLLGMYFTLSSCRVKMRYETHERNPKLARNQRDMKGQMYEKQNGVCPMCGKHFTMSWMELHHVLPWRKFPELRAMKKNHMLLCHDCHKEIHCNPYLDIKLQEEKAKELGIDLKRVYNYEYSQD